MRILLVALVLTMVCGAATAETPSFLFGSLMMDRAIDGDGRGAWHLQESGAASPDTTNRALDDMLAQFMADPAATDISYDSWTYTAHRFLGYAILAGAATQVVLGAYTYNKEKDGERPGTIDAHRYLGYTIVGLSVTQTGLGFYNFRKMRDRDAGKIKRWVHLGLSTLATAGFIAAAVIAADSREQIESGQADIEGKTIEDLYSDHRTVGILATTSVVLTAIVIVW